MKASQRTSSATDIKGSQGISSATDTEHSEVSLVLQMRRLTQERIGSREKWITDKENKKEEAVDFETEYGTRHKSQKKQGASNRIMKVIQLEDEPLLPTPCRIMKVIELEQDVPNVTTLVTEEHHSQDVKQKQPLKSYPLRQRKTDIKTINCKQGASNNISAKVRGSNHQQDIRNSRIPIPTWRKKLRSNCQPKKLPAKPVGLFPKVTSHRTNKEITEEKKYEIRDDDGNINFTGEHQLDDTEDISRVNTNDSDGRSILQN